MKNYVSALTVTLLATDTLAFVVPTRPTRRLDLGSSLTPVEEGLDSLFWGWKPPTFSSEDSQAFDDWFWGTGDGGVGSAIFCTDSRGVILFDGVCNFCDASVQFFMDNDRLTALDPESPGSFRFAAQQSTIGRSLIQQQSGADPEDLKSIVLITNDGLFCKSDAVLRIAKDLRFPYSLLATVGQFFPGPLRDSIYNIVSENRKIFGEKDSCRIPEPEEVERFLS
mmetsp:Transcript_4052/g.9655  ORF Transcript_4052/g.9655 Transcript_4052/m.9655 type:complete len:224 (+) Transcript_4052:51-722(+)|eukprot:CAMPEP_0172607232 /NCGR_PEP_ID=MMETSP1068-20121228/27440_1 /TAXON_ID=35684 /ORGANISM="Pseudopedinella elastica, Strain CCMP716" /LENGTH=223 /DNA_ID=CAMNT_0013410179 /DNA_START=47 /DNA_END=718 /DNA_ORIENTATION=-